MTAVASAAAGALSSSSEAAAAAASFGASPLSLGSLPFFVGDHAASTAFFNLTPPASFFASFFANSMQNMASQIQIPTPSTPQQHSSTSSSALVPVHQPSSHQQHTPPRSSMGSPPPGIYCDLGPAVFERTSRGYTVLRFEGYSFSKISDNRTKTYWRCANRTCRAKVHTNGGRIVYVGREPHDHKPKIAGSSGPKIRRIKANLNAPSAFQQFQQLPQHQQQQFGDFAPLDLRPKKEQISVIQPPQVCGGGGEMLMKDEPSEEGACVKLSLSSLAKDEEDAVEDFSPSSSPVPSSASSSPASSPVPPESSSLKKKKSKMMMSVPSVRQLPRSSSEVELFRLLQRANLLAYYDVFVSRGGDDVQQLVEANEEEFAEILRLVDMTSKPLHVRRLQKVLSEWHANPSSFRVPLTPAELTSLTAASEKVLSPRLPTTPSSVIVPVVATGASSIKSSGSSAVSPRHLGGGDTSTTTSDLITNNGIAPINLCIVSHSAYPTATSSSSSGSPLTHNSLSRASPSVFFNPNPNGGLVNARLIGGDPPPHAQSSVPLSNLRQQTGNSDDQSTDTSSGVGEFENTDSDTSSFCTNLSIDSSAVCPENNGSNSGGLLMLNHQAAKAAPSLTTEMCNQIIQKATELIAKYPDILQLAPKTEFSGARLKAHEVQQLLAVVDMPHDHPNFLESVQRFSMIYGRFDARRKNPERRLNLHELAVNEAAAALALLVPALLTHRERLYQLARQTVREAGITILPSPTLSFPRPNGSRPGSVSPSLAALSNNTQRFQPQPLTTFATPTPPAAHSGKTILLQSDPVKRSRFNDPSSSSSVAEPPKKNARRSVITESGEIIFPSTEVTDRPEDLAAAAAASLSTSDSIQTTPTAVAMALAQQLGFAELAVELQKDQEETVLKQEKPEENEDEEDK